MKFILYLTAFCMAISSGLILKNSPTDMSGLGNFVRSIGLLICSILLAACTYFSKSNSTLKILISFFGIILLITIINVIGSLIKSRIKKKH